MRKGFLLTGLVVGLTLALVVGKSFQQRFGDQSDSVMAGGGELEKAAPPGNAEQAPAEQAPAPEASDADVRRITVSQLRDALKKGSALVVDVRTGRKYAAGHIKGAIHIPSDELPARAGELPRDRLIVMYCA